MKPPKTNIELVPPESILKAYKICLLSSYPMVPTTTTINASSGPALPKIEEKATKLDRAHLKPDVRLARYPGSSSKFVSQKLYDLS